MYARTRYLGEHSDDDDERWKAENDGDSAEDGVIRERKPTQRLVMNADLHAIERGATRASVPAPRDMSAQVFSAAAITALSLTVVP